MCQSSPACPSPPPPPPPPSGNKRGICLILGVGHLQFWSLPKGGAFAYPRDKPRIFDTLTVLVSHVAENVVFEVKRRFCRGIAKLTKNTIAGTDFLRPAVFSFFTFFPVFFGASCMHYYMCIFVRVCWKLCRPMYYDMPRNITHSKHVPSSR